MKALCRLPACSTHKFCKPTSIQYNQLVAATVYCCMRRARKTNSPHTLLMEIINRIPRMISIGRDLRSQGKRIALVPTKGSLHEGHLSLTTRARELCDTVVISIVPATPAKEGPENPPTSLARDAELAFTRGVDF